MESKSGDINMSVGITHKCIIFGDKNVAKVIFESIRDDKDTLLDVKGFCVDPEYLKEDSLYNLPIVSFDEVSERFPPVEYSVLVAMGYLDMNKKRELKCRQFESKGYKLVSFIHSKANVASSAVIGDNCVVLDNVNIGPFTEVGNNTFIYNGVTLSHHDKVGNNCWIASGTVIGGESVVGDCCFIGISAIIGDNTAIGNENFIGAGAKITHNTDDGSVYVISDTQKNRLNTSQFIRLSKFM